MTEADCARVV